MRQHLVPFLEQNSSQSIKTSTVIWTEVQTLLWMEAFPEVGALQRVALHVKQLERGQVIKIHM